MYGRNNIFANNSNSNSNSNNNNSSYRSNSYSYSGRNNEKLGTYRTDYRYEQPPQYLTAIISVWKQNPPLTIASREEVLHLTPTQIRVQDYYLIRNKKLASLHQDKLRDAIRKQCFNEDLMRNGCYNLLPYSNDRPFDIDTVKAIVRKYEANSNNSYSYGSYNNNDNSRNSNSYTNNSASSNNIFNRNSGSGNNSSNNGSNIFQNSNNSNNIFNRNSNNSNNTSNNNNNNNNIFASRNTNSYANNNIFNNNNNSNNNNNNNNNYNNNNNSNNIFNNNGSSGNNIFNNNNNNNNNSNNNIFNNSNSNNRSIFNNGNSGNNIFNNSNNNNGNIFNNNNRNNNIFNNNMSNNNGGNIFNNNNNNNIFNKGNNSNFNNSGNGGLNSMLPNFFTQLQTYMKNVNDVVHRLNINISPNQTQSRNISENKPSIFAGKEVQEYDYQAQIKNKKKLKNKDEYRTFTEHESDSNNYSDQGEGEQKQSIKGSRLLGSHLKNTYQDYYKNTSSVIYSNKPNQSSKMSNQQRLQGSSQLHMNSVIKRNKGSSNISNSMSGNASQQEQDYNGPCKCWLKLKIYWLDSKKDIKLPADLTITLELQNFHPNNKQWKAALIQKLKQRNGLIRSDASIEFTFYARPQQDCMHYDIVGMISQKIFNLQNYEIKYARMVGNCAEQLQIYNEYGSIEWYDPIDLVGLDFKESQFSIQKNMIILCNDSPLNCKCLVSFNQLPDNISKIIQQDGDIKKAQEKLRKTVHKTSQGYFNLIDIRKNGGQEGWRMQVTRFP